jgi:hypothetical protein
MKKKKKKKNYWNYRIITILYKNEIVNIEERLFSIVEVYYKKGKPESYAEKNILNSHYSKKDLKWSFKHIKKAFKNPILDADNWPNEWIRNKKSK